MIGAVGMLLGGEDGRRYELISPLGSGAFGDAWKARDTEEDDVVAVKLLDPRVDPDDVLREAALHRRLSDNARVVSMRNVALGASPSTFVVTELVPGGSLQSVLDARRPSVRETHRWLRDVLEGLIHAHAMGVLHRDIKPSNVLLGADGHGMLTDFGNSEDAVRRAAAVIPMYNPILPPEFPAEPTSPQTDLWLVGVMGWQMLVGERPDLAVAHTGTLPLAHRLSPEVPLALARAVHAGLAVDPADRPASADLMLQSIGAAPVRAGWHDHDTGDPDVIRAWQADEAGKGVRVQIRKRSAGGYRVTAHAAAGKRLRTARSVDKPTLAGAERAARVWLLRVVAGNPL